MVKFITLAGKKQVGKDTSAGMIKELLNPSWTCEAVQASPDGYLALKENVHIVHFADALKKACNVIFGIPLEDMETEEGKQKLTHVRWPLDESGCYEGLGGPPENAMWAPYDGQPPGPKFMTVREILQFVGTDLFRNQLDPDIWVESVFRQPWAEDDIVIIADARFPNEADFALEHGILIGINRDTGIVSDGHKSETALDDYSDYHYVVDNNSSFADLRMHLQGILIQRQLTTLA